MFFFEGPKVLFKVALSILNLSFGSSKVQKQIPGFFELTRALRNLTIEVTHEDVLIPEVRVSVHANVYYTIVYSIAGALNLANQ